MSTKMFSVRSHTIPGQYIREYPQATAHEQEDELKLVVKQYTPCNNPNPQYGDVTIFAAHATGYPKELYEPMWDELISYSQTHGFRIRSIWMADMVNQGESGVENETTLGDDHGWDDHTRDLLHIINHFRKEMPRPLVGVGHSMGGTQLTSLALIHPRLFASLVLIEPMISIPKASFANLGPYGLLISNYRRDTWPSREEAAHLFKNNRTYRSWDERVLDLWIAYGLRDMPTMLHPDETCGVTLTTPKHHEVHTYFRPKFEPINKRTHPDIDPEVIDPIPFYCPVPRRTLKMLPFLRPSVMYIVGAKSPLTRPAMRQQWLDTTGTGVGGSGGHVEGKVEEELLPTGHMVPFEAVAACAETAGKWISKVIVQWLEEEKRFRWEAAEKKTRNESGVGAEWLKQVGRYIKPPNAGKL